MGPMIEDARNELEEDILGQFHLNTWRSTVNYLFSL